MPKETTSAGGSQEVAKLATNHQVMLTKTHRKDYFLVTHEFPWQVVKDVVIRHMGYGNYMVAHAIQMNVTTVDALLTMSRCIRRANTLIKIICQRVTSIKNSLRNSTSRREHTKNAFADRV